MTHRRTRLTSLARGDQREKICPLLCVGRRPDWHCANLKIASGGVLAQPTLPSELPEPEVFAMVLIGWRASKHSEEKFE